MIVQWALIVSLVLLAYTYAGYPAILWIGCVFRRRTAIPENNKPRSVSVVVCAHNEEKTVAAKIENLLSQSGTPEDYEVLVASDGSTDGTARAAEAAVSGVRCQVSGFGGRVTKNQEPGTLLLNQAPPQPRTRRRQGYGGQATNSSVPGPTVRVFDFPEHRGKAAVLNEVIPQCRGEIVVLVDTRQELALDAVQNLCRRFADPAIGAVSGELVFRRRPADGASAEGVDSYWRYEKAIRGMESCLDSTCGCTGALYAIRKDLYHPVHPDTVLDDVAIPMRILMLGKRVVFEETARAYDEPSADLALENRRKARTLAGNFQLCALYPELLNPFRNRIWAQFVSHKLMRLLCPWFLLLLLGTSGMLARTEPRTLPLFLPQVVFYALAMAGLLLQHRGCPWPLSLPAAFVSMNWAAVRGLFRFLRGNLSGRWE